VKKYCSPGDWASIPLWDGTFGLTKIARVDKRGYLCGYFFTRLVLQIPTTDDISGLSSDNPSFVARIDPYGFRDDGWQTFVRPEVFDPAEWPLPTFRAEDLLIPRIRNTEYSDEDLLEPVRVWYSDVSSTQIDTRIRDSILTPGVVSDLMKRELRNEYYERR
jgi:hypothetical protein